MRDSPLPCDNPAVRNHCSVVSVIWCTTVYNFDAVAIQVKDRSVEVAVIISPACWRSVGLGSGIQGCGIKVSNSCATCSGECDVCCAGFDSDLLSVVVYLDMDRPTYPGVSWLRKKSASRIPKLT